MKTLTYLSTNNMVRHVSETNSPSLHEGLPVPHRGKVRSPSSQQIFLLGQLLLEREERMRQITPDCSHWSALRRATAGETNGKSPEAILSMLRHSCCQRVPRSFPIQAGELKWGTAALATGVKHATLVHGLATCEWQPAFHSKQIQPNLVGTGTCPDLIRAVVNIDGALDARSLGRPTRSVKHSASLTTAPLCITSSPDTQWPWQKRALFSWQLILQNFLTNRTNGTLNPRGKSSLKGFGRGGQVKATKVPLR